VNVSPTDIEGTADAIYLALTMDRDERKRRATELRDSIVEQDIVQWIYRQLVDIAEIERT
jgi:trehalose 6-phosphate synthase